MIPIATIDFETKPIEPRPHYPPEPVGLAITMPDGKSEYMAWGHPEGNNCTKAQAKRRLKQLYADYQINTHHGKFDLEVGEKFFGLPLIPKHNWHDSMLLAFLHNPREPNLKLKPLADKWLNMPAVEKNKLDDWILTHIFTSQKSAKGQVKIFNTAQKKKPKGWFRIPPSKTGMFICYAPVPLAGRYAKGDTIRTKKLTTKFLKYVRDMGMLDQYEIEKRAVIKAIEMEREGVPIDYKLLEPELVKAKKKKQRAENAVFKVLGDINLNSAPQKIEAFERLGLVDEWELTEKGNPSTAIDSLMRVCTDVKLVKQLEIFSKYDKLIGTYMQPWLNSALENNGRFYPWFNTIKGDNDKGTYTGRFSSNFQQVPRRPNEVFKGMPFLRNFIIPDKKSHLLFNRDFSQQEIRILAHFGDGGLLMAYQLNPDMSGHDFVRDLIAEQSGIILAHVVVKGCNFLIVYGGGAKALSKNAGITIEDAVDVFKLHGQALPEVKELKKELLLLARKDEMFRTAGGRWYDFEEGFEYVALNTLIQGSAADHSKRALLNVDDMLKSEYPDSRINLMVHDEIMVSGDKRRKKKLMADFKAAMEHDELFDLDMLTDGKMGSTWGGMLKYND